MFALAYERVSSMLVRVVRRYSVGRGGGGGRSPTPGIGEGKVRNLIRIGDQPNMSPVGTQSNEGTKQRKGGDAVGWPLLGEGTTLNRPLPTPVGLLRQPPPPPPLSLDSSG